MKLLIKDLSQTTCIIPGWYQDLSILISWLEKSEYTEYQQYRRKVYSEQISLQFEIKTSLPTQSETSLTMKCAPKYTTYVFGGFSMDSAVLYPLEK